MQRTLRLAPLFLTAFAFAPGVVEAQASDLHVRVDAFGYRPLATKVAVFREPVIGYDAPAAYVPPATAEVRRASDGTLAYTGPVTSWNAGAVHGQSGDRAWWFDFGDVEVEGTYYVIDPVNGARSEDFRIASDVYRSVLRDAVRMFFYQRCGFAKNVPFADANWTDGASHLGPEQDTDCRLVSNPVPSTSRDLSGGWYDAGDYNKYVNFADDVVHELLYAFRATPHRWPDDFGIPESGNGVPDLLDELKWELDWMLRMQEGDGSVLHKVSVTDFSASSPPSADTAPRRYAPATASATISACGTYAHAARVFATRPEPALQAYAAQLESAAVAAWNWLVANPATIPSSYDNAGFSNVAAEDSPYFQDMNHIAAAVHLFALTGAPAYRSFVDTRYTEAHLFQWFWASQWELNVMDPLLDYARQPNATATVSTSILDQYGTRLALDHLGVQATEPDAYRAYLEDGDTGWGSNGIKSGRGTLYVLANELGMDVANASRYLELGEDYLHYLHGVNPTGYCYLTNMVDAPSSVPEMYHGWFADGTIWDGGNLGPPPGYLVGGANPSFSPDGAYTGPPISPPTGQPTQKSFLAWNTSWPQNSWEVTEPALGYQSAYVRLLAAFALERPAMLSLDVPVLFGGSSATFELGGAEPGAICAILWGYQPGSFSACLPIWCFELGLSLGPNPLAHLLALGAADGNGVLSTTAFAPPSVTGTTVHFQGTQAGSTPIVSGVVPGLVR